MISFKYHILSITLRYATKDCIHKKRAHLGMRPQLQTQGAFLGSGVPLKVILTESDSFWSHFFYKHIQLNLVIERVIQDTAIYMCAISCVPILKNGFCRTLLFKHKPNNFGTVKKPQSSIFGKVV